MGEKQKLTKAELEALVNGESVQKEINEELTYKELYASTENIWSALLMTGYLTKRGEADGKRYHLVVPNQEIRNIITEYILIRFRENVVRDGAMAEKWQMGVEQILNYGIACNRKKCKVMMKRSK